MAEDTVGIQYMENFFKGKDGYLIDIGATTGSEKGSMSRALISRGWHALMVEPLPATFAKLKTVYDSSQNVTCVNVACSDVNEIAEFYPCAGVSTFHPKWRDVAAGRWKHVNYGSPIQVQKRKLSELLVEHKAPQKIDLLQIDTEGHDLYVLRGMDWSREITMICVEVIDLTNMHRKIRGKWTPSPELTAFLKSKGFTCRLITKGGNGFYTKETENA